MTLKIKRTKAAILVKQKTPLVLDYITLPNRLFTGQVLVKIKYSGICGSQLGEIEGVKGKDKYLPHLLGHEATGEVIDYHNSVKKINKGDAVLLHWMPGSGLSSSGPVYKWKNRNVNAGTVTTFNTYSIVSENKITKIPTNSKDEKETLLLGCTASTAIGAVEKLAKLKKGQSIAVVGCGAIGLPLIKAAKILGAKNIIAIDLSAAKLKFAKKFGANFLINSSQTGFKEKILKKFPKKLDHFFECTGNINVISNAYECLKANGNQILIGVPPFNKKAQFYTLDINLGKNLIGCKGGNFNPIKDLKRYMSFIKKKSFMAKSLITNEVDLKDINDVFSDMKKNKIKGKCIINLNQE